VKNSVQNKQVEKCKWCDSPMPHRHVSKECELFDICLNKECLKDGVVLWSMNLCYGLYDLLKAKMIKSEKPIFKNFDKPYFNKILKFNLKEMNLFLKEMNLLIEKRESYGKIKNKT